MQFYCPGLIINLDEINISSATAFDLSKRTVTILNYDVNDERFIKKYFADTTLGYIKVKDNNFFKKESNDDFINDIDDAVGKTFTLEKNHSVVIFDETKQTIIIIEYVK